MKQHHIRVHKVLYVDYLFVCGDDEDPAEVFEEDDSLSVDVDTYQWDMSVLETTDVPEREYGQETFGATPDYELEFYDGTCGPALGARLRYRNGEKILKEIHLTETVVRRLLGVT